MMRAAADITVRTVRDIDYEIVARLQTAAYPDSPTSADEVRYWVGEQTEPGVGNEWVLAEDQRTAAVAGVCWFHQTRALSPHKYRLWGFVHSDYEPRGIGRRLMETALQALHARGARQVHTTAREDRSRSVAFLQRAGFAEEGRDFESRLPVAACDLAAFAGCVDKMRQLGVDLTTLADELARDPSCLRAVYQAHAALALAVPREDPEAPIPRSFDHFRAWEVEHPVVLKDAYFLAKRGDVYVGESVIKRSAADTGVLHQELTAVLPEYRGRGVATALKVLTVRYAQHHGFREIRTFNHTENAPMLAINAKLGFVRQPAWIFFKKAL